jgi:hypothetical protein
MTEAKKINRPTANYRKRREAILAMAREQHNTDSREGELEIDDNAKLSEGDDNGTYVQAWVWVSFAGTPLDKEPKDT